jgi:uncharacterized protein YndB with AHSA1/START domain
VSELIPAEPERIYAAWMDSAEHTAFTGDTARIEPYVGGRHSVFDGYAVGSTVELLPGRRIVQTWRATDFPPGSPDSRVEVTLEATVGGTMVTIFHTEIPTGHGDEYRDAWLRHYLEPLKGYFTGAVVAHAHKGSNGVPKTPPRIKAKPKAKVEARSKARPKAKARSAKRAAKKKPAAKRRPVSKKTVNKKTVKRKAATKKAKRR